MSDRGLYVDDMWCYHRRRFLEESTGAGAEATGSHAAEAAGGGHGEASLIDVNIQYPILSIGVVTLGLLMAVEVLRHGLDHAAKGRPIFHAVLEGVYTELSTLGMLEFLLFLVAFYYNPHHSARYYLFNLIHFALFYTAILNAFQSLLLAFVATRVSRKLWVQMETLQLHHYVEIREAFDQVTKELKSLMQAENDARHDSKLPHLSGKYKFLSSHVGAEESFDFTRKSLLNLVRSIKTWIRYPALKRKYDQLLPQVRFHELRVHFLESYKLPMKLRISDYLMRSQQRVFLKLVHVSPVAWLLLTGAVNLLYYVNGMSVYQSGNPYAGGTVLTSIFFSGIGFFAAMAFLIFNKMKHVFHSIMAEKSLWDVDNIDSAERERLAQKQKDLFWGGDPKLVIAAIQFMQFGYALALSVLIIFKGYIGNHSTVLIGWYVFVAFVSYGIFVWFVAEAIPRYTLCISLGQLVDEGRLRETLAEFYLKEAQHRELCHADSEHVKEVKSKAHKESRTHKFDEVDRVGIIDTTSLNAGLSSREAVRRPTEEFNETAQLMAELVKLDTCELRASLPDHERRRLAPTEMRHSAPGSRTRSLSDGVSFLAGLRSSVFLGQQGDPSTMTSHETAENVAFSAEDELNANDTLPEQLRVRSRARSRRPKSVSDGVASLAWINSRVRTSEAHMIIVQDNEGEQGTPQNATHKVTNSDFAKEKDFLGQKAISVPVPSSSVNKQTPLSKYADATDESVSRFSDTDDIPNVTTPHSIWPDPRQTKLVSFCEKLKRYLLFNNTHGSVRERLRRYFLSRTYVLFSNVFGTLVAFFFVGQRVELFVETEFFFPAIFLSRKLNHELTFWFLSAWFVCFLCGDAILLWCMRLSRAADLNAERRARVAACMDLVIVAVCCTVLFLAEAKRCCDPGASISDSPEGTIIPDGSVEPQSTVAPYGSIAPSISMAPTMAPSFSPSASMPPSSVPTAAANQLGPDCGCPPFGTRLYGGLGPIEPYTSLICLRIFRDWLARRIVLFLNGRDFWTMKDTDDSNLELNSNPFDVFGDHGSDKHGHDSHGHDSHGHHGHGNELKGTAAELWEYALRKHPEIVARHGEFSGELLKAMLGLEVETSHTGMTHGGVHGVQNLGQPPSGVVAAPDSLAPALFMVPEVHHNVTEPPAPEDHALNASMRSIRDDSDSPFLSPNSRLIRGMRRCERMLLPILTTWTVVDVVLTRFEMVYFEVDDRHNMDEAEADQTTQQQMALADTKGGKGLRLCDVASGRRVVGKLELSEIASIFVDHQILGDQPCERTNCPDVGAENLEYWLTRTVGPPGGRTWLVTQQDTLLIETVLGRKLLLRFYADLEEDARHPYRGHDADGRLAPMYKNHAFMWALTMGRVCGAEQLHQQSLVHFASGTDDELRDYLLVTRRASRRKSRNYSILVPAPAGRSPGSALLRRARSSQAPGHNDAAYPNQLHSSSFQETGNQPSRSISTGDAENEVTNVLSPPRALGRAVTLDVAELHRPDSMITTTSTAQRVGFSAIAASGLHHPDVDTKPEAIPDV